MGIFVVADTIMGNAVAGRGLDLSLPAQDSGSSTCPGGGSGGGGVREGMGVGGLALSIHIL